MDIRLALMAGIDIPIPQCGLIIHQPTIKEIAFIGEEDFFLGYQTLSVNQSMYLEDKDDLGEISNFKIFMTIISDEESKRKKEAVKQVLTIFFPQYTVMFTPRSIIFKHSEMNGLITIDEDNFLDFQDIIKQICCERDGPMDQHGFNPGNDRAKEIAKKLMAGRQRVAEQKGETNMSIFSIYLSTLAIGLAMPLSELLKLTMFQLYDLLERYGLYIGWDIDIRVRLAGGKPDSQPDSWMKNIH